MNDTVFISPNRLACARQASPVARFAALVLGITSLIATPDAHAAEVLTQHNDQFRTGSNLSETTLTPSNVNSASFGKLFSYSVDGQVYAQPLVVQNLAIGGGTHNVVYVATMEDSVYAFDADRNASFWHVRFTSGNITPVPITDITNNNNLNIHGNVGILSTPVIDRGTGTIYVFARTKDTGNSTYHQHLHALDIATGAEKFGGPVEVTANGFNSKMESQRTALGLSRGNIYIAWASHEDFGPYHGWVMAYSASNLSQVAVFNDTASGSAGGIWQSGQGPTFDDVGNLYFMTGNGDWNGTTNFGMSFIKLSPTLRVLDWFTEADFASENSRDDDLGASGPLLLPTSAGYPATQFVIGAGKQGRMFVLDKTNGMGHMTAGDSGAHQNFQAVQTAACSHHLHGSPIYWNSATQGQLVFIWGENDVGKTFRFNGSTLTTSSVSSTAVKTPTVGCGMPGATLSVSANGGSNGIVWANCVLSGDALHNTVPGILRAYDANNLGRELWNSEMDATQDGSGNLAKFVAPTVANGKVYLASFSNLVHVYGAVAGGSTGGPLANGTYKLVNRTTGKIMDNLGVSTDLAPVGQWTSSGSTNQRWVVTNVTGAVYKLSCVTGGKFLDTLGGTANGATVGQFTGGSSTNQQWTITAVAGGFFKLTNVATGKCLDGAGSTTNGAVVVQWADNPSPNQQWQFTAP